MRHLIIATAALSLAACGLENFFSNVGRQEYPRPASAIRGSLAIAAPDVSALTVFDGTYAEIEPFYSALDGQNYELRLPSAKYSMILVQQRSGDMVLRALVPFVGEESEVTGVDVDSRAMTETLIVEARLSADDATLRQVTPEAYVGTRDLIRAAFDAPGPTRDLLLMVERIIAKHDPAGGGAPMFFIVPELDPAFAVTTSPLDPGYINRNPFDLDGDGAFELGNEKFNAKLAEVAALYRPAGCPDPERIRVVFSVDFNEGALNGNCAASDRFKWAVDKPGKQMFFVGWVHQQSPIQDPAVNNLLGSSTPNTVPMYDDGTNGDEVAGDNIWTVYFDVPRGTEGNRLRVGYKYTWGTRGAVWTGSEEWPGNSRILEVVDVNGDDFVHRRDVFGDEATNKDNANLNFGGTGSITWTTDLRGCGPEAWEQKVTLHNACTCEEWITPKAVGPLTRACS